MATGLPVSYSENGWAIILFRVLGCGALLGGAALLASGGRGESPFGVALVAAATCALVVNEIVALRLRRKQRSVLDTGSGLRWLGGPVELNVEDSQVVAVRLKRTPKYSSGILQAVVRRFEIWTVGAPGTPGRNEPLCMCNRVNVGSSDLLAPLIERMIGSLKERTAAALADGAALDGEGWRLAAMQLSVVRGRGLEQLPFAEIDKVALFDGKYCIWQKGRDEPFAKIDPGSKNAPVLVSLLGEWIEHQQAASGEKPAESTGGAGMGRLLFERRRNDGLWLGLLAFLLGGGFGTVMLAHPEVRVLGMALCLGGVTAGVLGLLFGRYVFCCYEQGLVRRRGRRETRMLYAEIVEFNYSATRHFTNGAYTGTTFAFTFRSPGAKINYGGSGNTSDADLEGLRDHIAKVIAHRMLCELREGRPVPWGNDVVFLPQGVQFRRAKMFSTGPAEMLPYPQIHGTNLAKGVFYLFGKGEPKAVFTKPVASPNFFPGFYLLLTLLNKQSQDRPAAEGAGKQGQDTGTAL